MRDKILKGIVFTSLIITIAYVIFTPVYYFLFSRISGNLTNDIMLYVDIIYLLLIVSAIISVISIILTIKNKGKLNALYIVTIVLFLLTLVFSAPFSYLEYDSGEHYPATYRYDNLFIYNYVYSNEGDDQSGNGSNKYIYIPIAKKIIYYINNEFRIEDVKFLSRKVVKIGNTKYSVVRSYFTES